MSIFYLTLVVFIIYSSVFDVSRTFSSVDVLREHELFRQINLNYPGLEPVKEAEMRGDREAAKKLLTYYYQVRKKPPWPVHHKVHQKKPPQKVNTLKADLVLRREFEFLGKKAQLTKMINWDEDIMADPEWKAALNEHYFWIYLGQAYWQTHDEKYAEDFVAQLRSWLELYPRLDWFRSNCGEDGMRCLWRTIQF